MYDINITLTRPPVYLKELLVSDEFVHIIYKKITSRQLHESQSHHSYATENSLDLTGSPLETDLNFDDTVFSVEMNLDVDANSRQSEFNYLPIDIKTARQILNKYSRNPKKHDVLQYSKPIYCICDGTDKKHTVILGILLKENVFSRILVYAHGYFTSNNKSLSIDTLLKKHISNVGASQDKVFHKEISTFILYGQNFFNFHLNDQVICSGGILMDVTWNKCFQNIKYDTPSISLKFKILVGHYSSAVYSTLWKELDFLNFFVKIFKTCENDGDIFFPDSNMNNHILTFEEICTNICDLLDADVSKKLTRFKKTQIEFDITDIRSNMLLDKLWNILKCSRNIRNLKNSFCFLFEEIGQRNLKHVPLEESTSVIVFILRDLFKKQLVIPTLTYTQSLMLLIELGLEKLKNDYFYIITMIYAAATQSLSDKWKRLSSKEETSSFNESVNKLSMPQKKAFLQINDKFCFLTKLHIIIEFLIFTKNCTSLPQHIYNAFIEEVCNKYLSDNSTIEDFEQLKINMLHELTLFVEYDTSLLNTQSNPVTTLIEMSSQYKHSKITTVFHKSKELIFPQFVHDKKGDIDDECVFLTELVQYTENLH